MWSHIKEQDEGELKHSSQDAGDDGQVSINSAAQLDDVAESNV